MTPEDMAITITVGIMGVAGGIGATYLNIALQERRKKAKIDYTFYHKVDGVHYPHCDFPAMDDPKFINIFMRNRGELDGSVDLMLRAKGAMVPDSSKDNSSDSATQQDKISDGDWHSVTFCLKQNPNTQYLELTIGGKGVKKAKASCLYPPTYKYWKQGSMFHCRPPAP